MRCLGELRSFHRMTRGANFRPSEILRLSRRRFPGDSEILIGRRLFLCDRKAEDSTKDNQNAYRA